MNATAIRQGISYVTNSKGEKTALQLDLTNTDIQEIVEELIDTLDAVERRSEPTRPFADVKNEIPGESWPVTSLSPNLRLKS